MHWWIPPPKECLKASKTKYRKCSIVIVNRVTVQVTRQDGMIQVCVCRL